MTSTFLLAVGSADKHPLLDIDWTGFVQFGLFVLTALIALRQTLFGFHAKEAGEPAA